MTTGASNRHLTWRLELMDASGAVVRRISLRTRTIDAAIEAARSTDVATDRITNWLVTHADARIHAGHVLTYRPGRPRKV